MLLIIIGPILVITLLVLIGMYNSIISTKNKVAESFSAIDTVLQNRYDLIPNLVEVVKQYASHEAGVLGHVSEMRAKLVGTNGQANADRFAAENELQSTMKSIFALAENYPDLKASTNFLELQTQWSEMEDRLQGARRAYNASVKALNDKKEMFPSSIVAGMINIPAYSLYEATAEARTTQMDAKKMFAS
ncbi:LemA family protein [Candidatus Gracilibacteria bacterium]|nr:LemA family protein [Candidatus Gracilibacteria bacterium]